MLIPYNQWSHLVVTYDYGSTSNTPSFYLNGIKQTTNVGSGSPSGTHSLTAHTTYIGNNSAGTRTFDGHIDNVKIFNYTRSPAQIAWDYNHGGPVGWWKFDECQGTTAYDSSGNGWNGTISMTGTGTITSAGTCNSGTSSEAWNAGSTGKYSSALGFDGTSGDNVDAGDHDITGKISISAWVYSNSLTTSDGIIGKRNSTENAGDWLLRIDGTDAAKFEFITWNGLGNSDSDTSTGGITSGTWNHIVATYDDTANQVKFYINGKLDSTFTNNIDLADNVDTIKIGYGNQSASTQSWNGKIDDVLSIIT